ncbi:unnamed protein product [Penicillium salamii]|nr:unnamed protein product [Penicillium salamii]
MSPSAASSRTASSRLPSRPQKGSSQPPRRSTKRQSRHAWTDEELNLLSYLRYLRRWRFTQIQKSYFPSLSPSALLGAYWRLSTEDLETLAVPPTLNLRVPVLNMDHSSATGDEPVGQSSNTIRYNLRPNRSTTFPQRKPRYLVDQRRFPHFSKSYRYHLNLHRRSDIDYVPLSHTSTPNSSDRSPSVVSSPPSVVSSLEIFGLEARSLNLSDRGSSVTSSLSDDISSAEFFSSEERPPTP